MTDRPTDRWSHRKVRLQILEKLWHIWKFVLCAEISWGNFSKIQKNIERTGEICAILCSSLIGVCQRITSIKDTVLAWKRGRWLWGGCGEDGSGGREGVWRNSLVCIYMDPALCRQGLLSLRLNKADNEDTEGSSIYNYSISGAYGKTQKG